jgi:hypothetical protein
MHLLNAFNDRRKAKRADKANTVAAIGAMAKSGTLRDAGPKPTAGDRNQLKADINDVKYEAQYGVSGRNSQNYSLPKKEALHNAGKALDKNIAALEKDPNANGGVRSATTWAKK